MQSIGIVLCLLLELAVFAHVWKRWSIWAKLAQHYPLGNEWPDLNCGGTRMHVGFFAYRVTIGSNRRGVTFHGIWQRFLGTALFIPWSEIDARLSKSFVLGTTIRLQFAKEPSRHLWVHAGVWENLASRAPIAGSAAAGATRRR